MNAKTLPVKAGDQIKLKIQGLNHNGEGVGRCQGLAVFVPFSVPGEEVLVRITQVKKNFARGDLLGVLEDCGCRCQPHCAVHGKCGGCQLQHLEYQEQLRVKKQLVEDSLVRIGKLEGVRVLPTLGMNRPWGYRNKVHYKVESNGERLFFGYYRAEEELTGFRQNTSLRGDKSPRQNNGSQLGENFRENTTPQKRLLRVEQCHLINDEMNRVAKIVEELLNSGGSSGGRQEFFRHVVLRKSSMSGEIMVVLVTEPGEWPGERELAGVLRERCPLVVSVIRNINPAKNGVVMGQRSRVVAGKAVLLDEIGGIRFTISPESFFQVNPVQTGVLYEKVLEYAALTGRETVIDAFCGIGTISLFLARKAGKVLGLEIVPAAVKDARENARLNMINNAEFIAGKVEELMPKLYRQGVRPDLVVLDPPRKGCEKSALEAIGGMKPQRLVYVSCDPGSLARDLAILSGLGYKTVEVQPVDMFPQTAHCEAVARIERVKG